MELKYVDSGEHYPIDAQDPGAGGGGVEGLGGTTSMQGWGKNDTVDVTHEFGHMLGNPEEYFTTDGHDYTNGGTVDGLSRLAAFQFLGPRARRLADQNGERHVQRRRGLDGLGDALGVRHLHAVRQPVRHADRYLHGDADQSVDTTAAIRISNPSSSTGSTE